MVRIAAFYEFRNLKPSTLRATMKKSQKLGGIGNVKHDGEAVPVLRKPNSGPKFQPASWYQANDQCAEGHPQNDQARMWQESLAGAITEACPLDSDGGSW
jgi:hypothetical protein